MTMSQAMHLNEPRTRRVSWRWALFALTIAIQIAGAAVAAGRFGWPFTARDQVHYQALGIFVSRGGMVYRDVWEFKPPLGPLTSGLLALPTGGDPLTMYVIASLATFLAALAVMTLIPALIHHYTGSRAAAVAGWALWILLPLPGLPIQGFFPKMLGLACGLGALWLTTRDRFFWAGVLAAMAAGYWQMGVFFPLIVLAMAALQGRFWRTLGAVLIVAVLIVLPFALGGGLPQLIEQTVLAPFAVTTDQRVGQQASLGAELLSRWRRLVRTYRPLGTALLLLGMTGGVWAGLRQPRRFGWLAAGVIAYTFQVAILDYDFFNDTLYLLAFAQIGLGIVVGAIPRVRSLQRNAALALLALTLLGAPSWFVQGNVLIRGNEDPFVLAYWDGALPKGCHFLAGPSEMRFAEAAKRPVNEAQCSADLAQTWGMFRARVSGK